jgi:uncharacterized DUF497 family protein
VPEYEWDPVKNELNEVNHGIAFDDAIDVFEDPSRVVEVSSQQGHGETRWVAIGRMGNQLIVVVFTMRNRRRIISARKAGRDEKRKYSRGETAS